MAKIASFQINNLLLNPGIYASRKEKAGDQILPTFDIRMTKPNYGPVMNAAEVHTIEHLGATFLRNDEEYECVLGSVVFTSCVYITIVFQV